MSSTITNDPNGQSQVKNRYESIEFTLNTGITDYDLDSQQATFKSVIAEPMYCRIYTSQNISIKFDATTNHTISLNSGTTTDFDRQIFKNIYLSNSSGANSTVRIYVK